MSALNLDPALNARRVATRMANPDNVANLRRVAVENASRWRATPEGRATLVQTARENIQRAHTPEAAEKRALAAKQGGIRRTLRLVPDLPESGVEEFRFLTKKKRVPTQDAVRMVREATPGTPEHARRQIERVTAEMRARQERQRRQAY